ncbi:MAG: TIGR04348 family glycosyltransferase [SAR324 cluster bacterium]|nr:TIGR04348 family glycosyltransferase [SAR324 cluster bacterium]
MHIRMITPAPAHSRKGNRISALRWARLLRQLGHRVSLSQQYAGESCGLLVALHAKRSHPAIAAYRQAFPDAPLIVVLTGTDVYRDIQHDDGARASLAMAGRLIVLQPLAIGELPARHRAKARVIPQSAPAPRSRPEPSRRAFEVSVVGHLRPVKDPFLAAEASRRLPPESRIRVIHLGAALEPGMEERARREMAENPRYRWLGEKPRWYTRRRMAASRVMVLSSIMEGGANVVSEAIVAGVPVLASSIPGSIGMLGGDYPGYFPVGDAEALASLLLRCEGDAGFLADLTRRVTRLAPQYTPERERQAWAELLAELIG